AAQERLRILGVKPDGTEPGIQGGRVVGIEPDGRLLLTGKAGTAGVKPETILPAGQAPGSTYSIWAPFAAPTLAREMIAPGAAVDTTHRIFTRANLETVWVEANIHESDFDRLARSEGGKIRFRPPAYPGQDFEGEVTYTGDLVDEKSRTIK